MLKPNIVMFLREVISRFAQGFNFLIDLSTQERDMIQI